MHCAASTEVCHKSSLYKILGFKDAGRRSRELYDLWGGKPPRCDFVSHQDIHNVLSNADIMSYPRRVEMCIVFHRVQSDEDCLPQIKEFTDMVQDLERSPFRAQDLEGSPSRASGVVLTIRVLLRDEIVHDKALMSDTEYCKERNEDVDWQCAYTSKGFFRETETLEVI
jgi:hypothetical protein